MTDYTPSEQVKDAMPGPGTAPDRLYMLGPLAATPGIPFAVVPRRRTRATILAHPVSKPKGTGR